MQPQEDGVSNLERSKEFNKNLIDPEILAMTAETPKQEEKPVEEQPAEPIAESSEEQQETTPEATEEEKFVLGDREYTQTEVQELIGKGQKIRDWEQKVPGNDIDKLYADYTKKSQRLAEYEKKIVAPVEQADDDLDLPPDQLDLLKRAAKKLGFVQREDMVKTSIESQKDAFLADHPEYLPQNDPANEKWSALMSEFNNFNWQTNPQRVTDFLERSHSQVAPNWQEKARGVEVKKQLLQRKSVSGLAQMGGGAAANAPDVKSSKLSTRQAELYRASGWSEKDIKDLLS